MQIDRAPYVPFEAGVEEAGWVLQSGALGKGHLHHALVRFAGADDAVVRPHRNAAHRVRRLSPFHLLDHVGGGLSDEHPDASQRLTAPIAQLLDPRVDQTGGGVLRFSLHVGYAPSGSATLASGSTAGPWMTVPSAANIEP